VSPTMTVVVLAVLWMIVIVPMIVRRKDERSRERSVSKFGQSMRALAKSPVESLSRTLTRDSGFGSGSGSGGSQDRVPHVLARRARGRAEVFVAGVASARRATARPAEQALPTRRPVPAAEETLMHPVERGQMSAARAQMMARRRRSLTILGAGTFVSLALWGLVGGATWLLAFTFVSALSGYVWFLRTQAVRDRARRENRLYRANERRSAGYEAMDFAAERIAEMPESVVRIDDDHLSLHNMDTIDLTGLYNADLFGEPALQRRAG